MEGDPDPTPMGSAMLSLVELRRQLVRRASELAIKAKTLHRRGLHLAAARAQEQSQRLLDIARSVDTKPPKDP